MHVERAKAGHRPHHLGQHAERHNHLQIGVIALELGQEVGVFHLHGLQHGQVVGLGILLHLAGLQMVLVTTYGFVGLRNHSHHVIAAFHQAAQSAHSKLGGTHEDDSQVFLIHCFLCVTGSFSRSKGTAMLPFDLQISGIFRTPTNFKATNRHHFRHFNEKYRLCNSLSHK